MTIEAPALTDGPALPARRHEGRTRSTLERTCDGIILGLLVAVLLLTPFAFGGVDQPDAPFSKTWLAPLLYYSRYLAYWCLILAVGTWLVKTAAMREVVFVRTPLDLPILCFIGYIAIWTIFSPARHATLTELLNVLSCAGIYYVVVNTIRSKRQIDTLLISMVVLAFVLTVIGIVQTMEYHVDNALTLTRPDTYKGRVGATYICPNHYAGYLEMVLPMVFGYLLLSKLSIGRKFFVGFGGLGLIAGLIFSQSRGAWVGFFVSMIFLFAAARWLKRIRVYLWIVPLIAIFGWFAFFVARHPLIHERFMRSFDREEGSFVARAEAWVDSVRLVAAHPVFGTGPGTFQWAFTPYQRPSHFFDLRFAHNDYLQTLADYGVVGLGLLGWLLVVFGRKALQLLGAVRHSTNKAYTVAVCAAALAIGSHSLFDFNMRILANALTMSVLVGILMSVRQWRLPRNGESTAPAVEREIAFRHAGRLSAVAAAAVVVVAGFAWTIPWHAAAVAHHRGHELDISLAQPINTGSEVSPATAERIQNAYETAMRLDPLDPTYPAALSNLCRWRARDTLEGRLRKGQAARDLDLAIRYARRAVRLNRLDAANYMLIAEANVGLYEVLTSNDVFAMLDRPAYEDPEVYRRRALDAFEQALERHPNHAYNRMRLGLFHYRLGQYEQARGHLERSLAIVEERGVWARPALEKYLQLTAARLMQNE